MKGVNHFVLRNGKLIPKKQADSQEAKTSYFGTSSTVQTVKTCTSEDRHAAQLEQLKRYYEDKIACFGEEIRRLRDRIVEKDQVITQLQSAYRNTYGIDSTTISGASECESLGTTKISHVASCWPNRQPLELIDNNSDAKVESLGCSRQENECQGMFDSSSLMKRLAHSENLVSNIKKFLKPASQQRNRSQTNQVQRERQLLQEILIKHQFVLESLDQLVQEKDEEMRRLTLYYQRIIVSQFHRRKASRCRDKDIALKSPTGTKRFHSEND